MKRFLCPEDERLFDVAAELARLHAAQREQIASGVALSVADMQAVADLSREHADLMTAARTYVCEGCGQSHPKGTESFDVIHHTVAYDAIGGLPRLIPMDKEHYTNVRCLKCQIEVHRGLVAQIRANEAAALEVRRAEIEAEVTA